MGAMKQKQAKMECNAEIRRIRTSKKHCYRKIHDQSDDKISYKCCGVSTDGSWPNKQLSRSSRNGLITFIDNNSGKVIWYDTRCKGYDFAMDKFSGDMEICMFSDGIKSLQSQGIHVNDISVDGDAKIKKLTTELNENDEVIQNLDEIQLRADKAHVKKHFPSKLLKFKNAYDWSAERGYNIKGFTEKYCRLISDAMFQYAFHEESVKTIDEAKLKIHEVICHYAPMDEHHTDCFRNQYTFCKTAFGSARNRSSALKSPLPIGFGQLLEEFVYTELLDDTKMEVLLRPGCTSLNEACNKVINAYSHKKRYLAPKSYRHFVARGVCQWNKPYMHLLDELESFGVYLGTSHCNWFESQLANRNWVNEWSTSRERYLAKHQKKYGLPNLDSSSYVGGCSAFLG